MLPCNEAVRSKSMVLGPSTQNGAISVYATWDDAGNERAASLTAKKSSIKAAAVLFVELVMRVVTSVSSDSVLFSRAKI